MILRIAIAAFLIWLAIMLAGCSSTKQGPVASRSVSGGVTTTTYHDPNAAFNAALNNFFSR